MTIDDMLNRWSDGVIAELRSDNERNFPRLRKQAADFVKMGYQPEELVVVERETRLDVVPLSAIRRTK